ncbi:ABC transporter ATP-binding protein [Pyrococcus abyssi]|uniref:Iron (III) ABC transporter, atp-binding protein n=1 Tax=Pyrococcus abyssi (strain GE5 / Orsay) TaxID=272844 RepID=Q9UZY6_PYRAB|nr:ABC transporter ATP-binding protein [Pyrococcus abyssi]CAB49920.1 Iron transport ABC protein, ATP-binding [Pyrococcus abyssi GE5]CCE70418.1 TPA: iron (III) ABC transporter, atp-binding protein [Pyrococcus abyssi GE5]
MKVKVKVIEVSNLEFSYNGKNVLRGVNFDVGEGEFLVILGPNGAGKTTLLRCIAGILKCKGDVKVFGKSIRDMNRLELAKLLAYVPQRVEPGFLRVFDFVLLGRRPYMGLSPRREDLEAVRRALKLLRVEEFEDRVMKTLSGGELQKVAIARAIAQETPVILLDEPTNNLDPKSQIDVMRIIKDLIGEGKTVITVMHDLTLALRFGEKFLFLKDGEVTGIMTRDELEDRVLSETYGISVKVAKLGREIVPLVGADSL